ncbi:MAG TPA: hypothetical protein PK542_05960 [Treponemataceae bacterium]|nr:hypothetical protein [Treponemataceae bacterium]HPS44013.1 hypothetical protein [Treponemataceae bacterium]
MRPGKLLLSLVFSIFPVALWAYGFSLAGFDLVTVGYVPEDSDSPNVLTEGSVSARFIPASWVNFRGGISFLLPDTGNFFNPATESSTPGALLFDNASINLRPQLAPTLGITFFTGKLDDPASDSLIREWFKRSIDRPEFQDLPAGMAFSSESVIDGTGMMVASVPGNANCVTGFYGYWNSRKGSDAVFTADGRIGAVGDLWKLNAFAGFSLQPDALKPTFRGALTALLSNDSGNDLYISAGLRNTEFENSKIGRNLYFVFEPRLYWERTDLALTFFSSPVFPDNAISYIPEDSESNYLGANLLVGFGNLEEIGMRGGVSLLGSINPKDPGSVTPFSFSVTPFYTMMVSDFKCTLSTAIKPLSLDDPERAIQISLSMKAVY